MSFHEPKHDLAGALPHLPILKNGKTRQKWSWDLFFLRTITDVVRISLLSGESTKHPASSNCGACHRATRNWTRNRQVPPTRAMSADAFWRISGNPERAPPLLPTLKRVSRQRDGDGLRIHTSNSDQPNKSNCNPQQQQPTQQQQDATKDDSKLTTHENENGN